VFLWGILSRNRIVWGKKDLTREKLSKEEFSEEGRLSMERKGVFSGVI
jgi:hypothetical protein